MTRRAQKEQVHDFWQEAACGERLYLPDLTLERFNEQRAIRYDLEPEIVAFADFPSFAGRKTLEIGVGLGADHQSLAEAGADLWGVDLTRRAIDITSHRLSLFGLSSRLQNADAENLPFDEQLFDAVYSWGVIHHSPDTKKAIEEIWRVLRPGGEAKIMIYHSRSFVGLMLWLRYALFRFRPFLSLAELYDRFLESPGTKAYTVEEAKELFSAYSQVEIDTHLTHADLLDSEAGQRHTGLALTLARLIWPRRLIRLFFKSYGLFMTIRAIK